MSGLRTLIGSFGRAVRRPRLRHLALIAVGFVVASSGVAYAYLSATGSGTYGLAKAGALDAPALTVASHTPTSATLTWTPPSNPTDTTWTMTETGNLMSGGSCAEASPSPTCTVSGLAPGTTYHFQLTYTLHNWSKSSNTATVTTTAPPKTCGGTKTASLADGKTYTFTLLGGGGGQGGNTGGIGGAGSTVTGSLTTPSTGTFTVVYEVGCSGQGGRHTQGGAGGSGYAAGGTGGTAHTTNGGGGGGGGGATYLALKGSTTTVIAIAGGGGGGGGSKTPSSHSGSPALANRTIGATTAAIAGQNGKTPHDSSIGGMGTGAGGGGAGTKAPSGGAPYKTTPAATTGKTAGKGGTGGYNFKHSIGTVTGVGVTVTSFGTGTNGGAAGSITIHDPSEPAVSSSASPALSHAVPAVTGITPSTGPVAGGTQVTITGSGFAPTATVSFGTTPASSVTVESATELVATSPAHSAGPVDVVVTDATGTSATSPSDVFTYVTSQPSSSSSTAPTVTGITPSTGPAAGGTTVTITGTGFTTTTAVSFGTTRATIVTVTSSTKLTVATPAHTAGAVTVTVTTSGGSATAEFTYAGAPSTSSSSGSLSGGTSGGTS